MNPWLIKRTIDMQKWQRSMEYLGVLAYSGNEKGHRIELTMKSGEANLPLDGYTVRGYFYLGKPENPEAVMPVKGSASGNLAALDFPAEAYAVGQASVVVCAEKTGEQIPLYSGSYTVRNGSAKVIIDPSKTIPSLSALLGEIEEMRSVTADGRAQQEQMAEEFAGYQGEIDDIKADLDDLSSNFFIKNKSSVYSGEFVGGQSSSLDTSKVYAIPRNMLNGINIVKRIKVGRRYGNFYFKIYKITYNENDLAVQKIELLKEVSASYSNSDPNNPWYSDIEFGTGIRLNENETIGISNDGTNLIVQRMINRPDENVWYEIDDINRLVYSKFELCVQVYGDENTYHNREIEFNRRIDMLESKRPNVYSALDYGIKPDDNTVLTNADNLTELASKISENGGGTIYLPAGTYYFRIGSFIDLPDNITVIGDGDATVLRYGRFMINRYAETVNDRINFCAIKNLCIDDTGWIDIENYTYYMSHKAILGYFVDTFICDSVTMIGTPATALGVDYVKNATVTNCRFKECGCYFGIGDDFVAGASSIGFGSGGFDNESYIITNNIIDSSGSYGIMIEDMSRTYGSNVSGSVKGILIVNNIVKNGRRYGIAIRSCSNVSIHDNQIYDNVVGGILIEGKCDKVSVANNHVINNGCSENPEGFNVYDEFNIGGIFANHYGSGKDITNLRISSNSVINSVGSGIKTNSNSNENITISENYIQGSTKSGIENLGTYTSYVVNSNVLKNNAVNIINSCLDETFLSYNVEVN